MMASAGVTLNKKSMVWQLSQQGLFASYVMKIALARYVFERGILPVFFFFLIPYYFSLFLFLTILL